MYDLERPTVAEKNDLGRSPATEELSEFQPQSRGSVGVG
jgi:hypothetical protein